MTVKKTQQSLNATLKKTEQTLGSLENSLGNNVEASLLAIAENSEGNDGLPEGWQLVDIDDMTFKGEQRKPEENEEIVYVDIGSIDRDKKIISTPQQLLGKDAPSRARRVITKGDVLVSLTRPNLNAVALVPEKYDGQFASTGFEVLKPVGYDSRLLFSITRSKSFIDSISGTVQGALYPAAKSADVKSYEIPLPPLAEQTVIAQTLDTLLAQVDNIKTRLDAIPQILKTFRQSVLAAAVSGKLTEEWRGENECELSAWVSSSIGDVATVATGTTPKRTNLDYWTGGEIPWLTSASTGKSFTSEAEQFVTELAVKEGRLKLFGPGTLLIAMYGEGKTRGQVTELKMTATCNQACAAIIVNEETASKEFIKLRLIENYEETRKVAAGGAQPNLNLGKVREIPISLPSLKEQTEIVRRVEELFAFADQIEQQVKNAQERVNNLTQSILAKAFRGELTAQWRAENPDLITGENSAKALLAKIKEEREKLKPKKTNRKTAVRSQV